jgi:hypothetical protein
VLVFLLVSTAIEGLAMLCVAYVLRRKDTTSDFRYLSIFALLVALYDIPYVLLRGLSQFEYLLPASSSALVSNINYNILFWAQCVIVFLLVRDLYKMATQHLTGMQNLASAIFYVSVVISAVMAISAASTPHPNGYTWYAIALMQVERCSCILVLCLFTFFSFTAQKLGMTYGSRVFGVTFGMAILATNRMVTTALTWGNTPYRLQIDLVSEFVQIGAVTLWVVYFLKAEPERRLVTVDLNSPLLRWNEVARFFDKPAGQVVVSSPTTFIPDVREVVATAASGAQRPPNLAVGSSAR